MVSVSSPITSVPPTLPLVSAESASVTVPGVAAVASAEAANVMVSWTPKFSPSLTVQLPFNTPVFIDTIAWRSVQVLVAAGLVSSREVTTIVAAFATAGASATSSAAASARRAAGNEGARCGKVVVGTVMSPSNDGAVFTPRRAVTQDRAGNPNRAGGFRA
jgi:hypothetical protein